MTVICGQKILGKIQALRADSRKGLAVLIDPDKANDEHLSNLISWSNKIGVSFFFLGGSLVNSDHWDKVIGQIRRESDIPIVLFPGNISQVKKGPDAILFLSLVSGRNSELLIGQHVHAAPIIKSYGMEAISTAYILIDGGKPTAASYMSQTQPIPADKAEITGATSLASKYLGFKSIYLDAGSGAQAPIRLDHIRAASKEGKLPLIVGGGIRKAEQAEAAWESGADIVVIGNALEKESDFSNELAMAYLSANQNSNNL